MVRVYGSDPGGHVCIAYIEETADLNWRGLPGFVWTRARER